MLFLYILLTYLKAEFDLSTLALVAELTNNISKTLITLGNIFPIWFSLMREMSRQDLVYFHLPNIVTIVSIPAEKLMDSEGLHCNIVIQALHLLFCIVLSY